MNNTFVKAYLESCKSFETAMLGLKKSYEHCHEIGIKDDYDFNETEAYDALIIKLTRNSDVFFQQIIKGFFKLKQEPNMFFIDRLNFLEKLNIIDDKEILLQTKSFRNQAVHEYSAIAFQDLYKEAIFLTPLFQKVVTDFMNYSNKVFF